MRILFFILLTMSALFADFVRKDNLVMDTKNAYIWQDDEATPQMKKTWTEAIDYCESLEIGLWTDWRLPNINELSSIVDRTAYRPAIFGIFKDNMNPINMTYWTSTAQSHAGYAYFVDFYTGETWRTFKSEKKHVRCVH